MTDITVTKKMLQLLNTIDCSAYIKTLRLNVGR